MTKCVFQEMEAAEAPRLLESGVGGWQPVIWRKGGGALAELASVLAFGASMQSLGS